MNTKTRRLLQPLWNLFEVYLTPQAAEGVVLCVSGGLDSRALLEAVALWPKRFTRIVVASVDHAVRPESALEVQAVCARARVLGFDAYALTLLPGQRLDEASLRQSRYDALSQLVHSLGISCLVTAHTQDDQAEGFVMNLMGLGGGPEGAGMPVVSPRPLSRGPECGLGTGSLVKPGMTAEMGFCMVRPLLNFSRAYLLAILTELDIHDYFQDPTNHKGDGRRVQVRDFLRLHNSPKERLAELAQRRRMELEALQAQAASLDIPEAVKFHALKMELQKAFPGKDLRSAQKTLRQIAGRSI